MKLFLAVALIVAGLGAPNALARQWTEAQVSELTAEAVAAADQGLSVPEIALARLALAEDLSRLDAAYLGEFDRAADDLFGHLAAAYARGAVDPAMAGADWHIDRPAPPDLDLLHATVDAGVPPRAVLRDLLPQSAEYRALQQELQKLLSEAGGERDRIAQLRANLERWRWLPRDLPSTRVEVRIAEYALAFHRDSALSIQHAVIVGARRTPTPVFRADIVAITLNPDWTPPHSIVANELLPRFRRNPAAAAREGFDAIDSSGQVIDPSQVDWGARPFPYQIRQRPGPNNALGQLRFDLPNPFSVFLHDTPAKRLFERERRALSHGCIRVQAPLQLAAAMLGPDSAGLQEAIDTGEQQTIALTLAAPVYVLYFTTTVAPDGSIQYLDDIYGRDAAIVAALDNPRSPSTLASSRTEQCSP